MTDTNIEQSQQQSKIDSLKVVWQDTAAKTKKASWWLGEKISLGWKAVKGDKNAAEQNTAQDESGDGKVAGDDKKVAASDDVLSDGAVWSDDAAWSDDAFYTYTGGDNMESNFDA